MEANFNLGSLKIVHQHLIDYLMQSISNLDGNKKLITVEKRLPTDYVSIDNLLKTQKALEMVGLFGISNVLILSQNAITQLKNVKYDTKKTVNIIDIVIHLLEQSISYINKIVTSGKDEPTVFFPIYLKLANELGKEVNIKDLFFPKLDMTSSSSLKNFKNGITITNQSKADLLEHLNSAHSIFQSKLSDIFDTLDLFGNFTDQSQKNAYEKGILDLISALDIVQKLKINKQYFVLYSVFKMYVSLLSPAFNNNHKSFISEQQTTIKSNLSLLERQIARLIQSVDGLEVGEKTSVLKPDEAIVKEFIFNICEIINKFPDLKESIYFKETSSIYDINSYLNQLFGVRIESKTISLEVIHKIEIAFAELKEYYNQLSKVSKNSPEFMSALSKTVMSDKKLNSFLGGINVAHELVSLFDDSLTQVSKDQNLFSNELNKELSLVLVLIDSIINNYIKNELVDLLDSELSKDLNIVKQRTALALSRSFNELTMFEMPQTDSISVKVETENTYKNIFSQISDDLALIEETLDYFIRNEGENIDELPRIIKPINNIKGVLSVIGESELVPVVGSIYDDWSKVITTGNFSLQDLQQSISLLSGLSLLVKAYSTGNSSEAEELQLNLLKLYYKNNSGSIATQEIVVDFPQNIEINTEISKPEIDNVHQVKEDYTIDVNIHNESESILKPIALEEDLSLDLPSFMNKPTTQKSEDVISNLTIDEMEVKVANTIIPDVAEKIIDMDVVVDSNTDNDIGEELTEKNDFTESTNDPDIAEVFLEEADSVLSELDVLLPKLRNDPSNLEIQKDVRRHYHTLKGSGRMVGLDFMGEAAWMIEQTLNKYLSNEMPFDSNFIDACDIVCTLFKDGVNSLKSENIVTVDLPYVKHVVSKFNSSLINHVSIPEYKEFEIEAVVEPDFSEQPADEDFVFDVIPEGVSENVVVDNTQNIVLEVEQTSYIDEIIHKDVAIEDVEIIKPNNNIMIDGVEVSSELYEIFNEESVCHIDTLKSFAHKNYHSVVDVSEDAMRSAHTLSSISASINMSLLSDVSRKLEDVLSYSIENDLKLSQVQMTPIRHVVDNLDLLKTLDSSSFVSFTNGLIESLDNLLSDLNNEVENKVLTVESSATEKSSPQIDLEELTTNITNSIAEMFNEQLKDIVSTIGNQSKELMNTITSLSSKVEDLEAKLESIKKEVAEKDKIISKALDVNKNDIRIMANIVKKKSERTETKLSDEAIQEAIDPEEEKFNSLADDLDSSSLDIDKSLDDLISSDDSTTEVLSDSDKRIKRFLEMNPLAAQIFEEKISTVADEIDDEIYELTILESNDLLASIEQRMEQIHEDSSLDISKELKRYMHTIKGSSRMAGANRVGLLMHRLESLFDYIETHKLTVLDIEDIVNKEINKIKFLFSKVNVKLSAEQALWLDNPISLTTTDNNIGSTAILESTKEGVQFIRVSTDVVDSAINEAGEVRLTRTTLEEINNKNKKSLVDLKTSSNKLVKMLKEVEVQAESQIKSRTEQLDADSAQFDPLEFDRFTRLQELTRFMNETVADINDSIGTIESQTKAQESTVSQQSIVSNNLLSELLKVRLVPVDTITERFYKIARNTTKELNKKVSLEIYGEKTELDKVILDKIINPIEHLLRNSIAHGIELPDYRELSGKPAAGLITINISIEGNSSIIKISDDGAGIDPEKIRNVAINKGIITSDTILTDDEAINLIFNSGFSTAESISQISGRGVGMDVVKSEISALGGTIKVNTKVGEGTTFTLSLPMSIASNQSTLVDVYGKLVCIPAVLVGEIVSLKEEHMLKAYETNKLTIRDEEFDLLYAGHLLGIVSKSNKPAIKNYNNIVIMKYLDKTLAIHVDKVITTTEILIKPLGSFYAKINGVLGATILGDGRQGIVINPLQIKEYYNNVISTVVDVNIDTSSDLNKVSSRKLVMVVDDSITVRRATTKVLERNGFSVMLAKDGEDALEQLQISKPDIILSDIEMPRMDGFEFVKNVRNVQRYDNIPIIMITSRTADKHKKFAFELGANDFLGKPYKEDELLEKIQELLEKNKEIY